MNAIVLGDVHAPFHDKKAWELVCALVADVAPSHVISIGDFMDCYAVSRYPKSRNRKLDISWEIAEAINLAEELMNFSPNSQYAITLGNHENRLCKYVDEHPELDSVEDLMFFRRMESLGWETYEYGESMRLGKLLLSHDFGRHGMTAAMQATKDVGHSCVFGHTHKAQIVYQPTIDGECHVAMNVGWLGDVSQLDYGHRDRARRDSMTGVGYVEFDDDGCFVMQFLPFIKTKTGYKTCVNGYWYEV